jgi:hypothetical protein
MPYNSQGAEPIFVNNLSKRRLKCTSILINSNERVLRDISRIGCEGLNHGNYQDFSRGAVNFPGKEVR